MVEGRLLASVFWEVRTGGEKDTWSKVSSRQVSLRRFGRAGPRPTFGKCLLGGSDGRGKDTWSKASFGRACVFWGVRTGGEKDTRQQLLGKVLESQRLPVVVPEVPKVAPTAIPQRTPSRAPGEAPRIPVPDSVISCPLAGRGLSSNHQTSGAISPAFRARLARVWGASWVGQRRVCREGLDSPPGSETVENLNSGTISPAVRSRLSRVWGAA